MYRVCVYAICKNEEPFVDRWVDSMEEADQIVVLDTGSTDNTVEKLRSRGVQVTTAVIDPWRFDVARNRSLDLVPEDTDICVCTDLDEVFVPGWREKVEQAWHTGARQLRYRYVWTFNADGSEGHVYWLDKIHDRHGFTWKHPVHEVLACETPVSKPIAQGVQLEHHPDPGKSRSQYLPLLELAYQEDPEDDRNVHYLGREYLYYRRFDEAIAMLKHHLIMPASTWPDERCASMRYIAQAFLAKGQPDTAYSWLLRAVAEAPYLREPWMDLCRYFYAKGDWYGLAWAALQCVKIVERTQSYICEPAAWGPMPYDLLSLALYYTGNFQGACNAVAKALELSPEDGRLKKNQAMMTAALQAQESGRAPVPLEK